MTSGSSGGTLLNRLVERLNELEHRIADERARDTPDLGALRRLGRERLLARDRMAALRGCAMPAWAREEA